MADTNVRQIPAHYSELLAREAVKILIEKKGVQVCLYDVRETSPITDYYINVTGRSLNQVAALADYLFDGLSERGRRAARIEGKRGDGWILVDYHDLIVNVFDKEAREFYDLDRLFPRESLIDITDEIRAVDEKMSANKNN
ncbi:MAG: ribosome silencing factor [Clostridia bacterium]|nr:ribosome silencing factor [Clostridia bacterium]